MARWSQSIPIIQEGASAIRNYVRQPECVRNMQVESVDLLVELARDSKFEKVKGIIGQALKMMMRVPEMENRIRTRNAYDLT